MGTFFLFAGTTLFLAGLGCLLAVFITTLAQLKTHRVTSIYFQKRSSARKWIPAIVGLAMVVASQGFYWFYDEVGKFVPFDDSIPQMHLAFVVEQDRTPRVELSFTDQNHVLSSQMVPLKGDRLFVTSEVIVWKGPMRALGLHDCYHFDGVYYDDADSMAVFDNRLPDYELNAGPTSLVSLIRALASVFPAEARIMISPAVDVNPNEKYVLEISPQTFSRLEEIDNLQASDYSQ